MMKRSPKWWLAIAVPVLLTPVLSAEPYHHKKDGCDGGESAKCRQVPEGGSGATYLLGVGVACLGAMFIRSRASKTRLS
jgi:hypothetical protein